MSSPTHSGIGLLGGSFNPPHRTHRRVASAALEQLPIEELRVLPAGDHPHKRDGDLAPARHRLAMCELAFAGLDRVAVDGREVARDGVSYTVDTLEELAAQHPDRRLFFLIGADNLPLLPTWRSHHRILELATFATFARSGTAIDEAGLARLDLTPDERRALLHHAVRFEPDAVSASAIRAELARGARGLAELDPSVEAYIRDHHLYGT